MEKKIVKKTSKELIEFGQYLNSFHDSSGITFEIEDAKRMKECSLNEVIKSFQSFFLEKPIAIKFGLREKIL